MTQATAPVAKQSVDFALLQQSAARHGGRNRRALWWLLGLLALLAGSVVTLLLYLNNYEAEDDLRRRAADAQWLEQSVQFHFRRLEDDLLVLARQSMLTPNADPYSTNEPPELNAGLLWREQGVILSSGWVPAGHLNGTPVGPERWQADWHAHPENAKDLALMQDLSQGLRRSVYAGLMRHRDGSLSDVIWLAVPFFDRGQFAGNYLAAVSMDQALTAMVPGWFMQDHRVQLLRDDALGGTPTAYRVGLNMPGIDLFAQVDQTRTQPATVPRIFFLVALLFLSGMLLSLYALRRDIVKRQQIQALLQAQVALRTAMENSVTIGLRAWDFGGKILYVNHAFCHIVGYSPD